MNRAAFVRQPVVVASSQILQLLDAVGDLAYVAGGAARQIVMGAEAPPAWDVDLFLYHPGDFERAVAAVAALGYVNDVDTERSSEFAPRIPGELPVQIIEYYRDAWSLTSGQPEDVLSHFSFTTETFAVVRRNRTTEAVVGATAVDDTLSHMLRVQNVTSPLVCGLRAVKHAYKGFGIEPDQLQIIFDAYLERARAEADKWRY